LLTADLAQCPIHFSKEYPFLNLNQDFLPCFRNVVKIRLAFSSGFSIFDTHPCGVWLWVEGVENATQVDRQEAD
jgi:hypothetical protein